MGFQSRSQGHRPSILFSGADGSVCRHVSFFADAHSLDLAECDVAFGWRNQARNLPELVDHARHHYGVLRADHRAAGRLWQLLLADSNRRGGHGLPGPEYALLLGNVSW